jgi:F-type H+-transporting ATPase subunit c
MKKFFVVSLVACLIILIASTVFAAETDPAKLNYYGMATAGALIGLGAAAGGGGAGMGHGIRGILEGSARNPGVTGKLLTLFIVGLALIESLVIYVLVFVLITFYANPFVK